MIRAVLFFVAFFLSASFTGKVISVADGDTITVLVNNSPTRIRLYGIDCPEIAHKAGDETQPFGTKAKEFTKELCAGKEVTVIEKDKDRYGRIVAIVMLPDGKNLNEELLRNGLAWHYKKYDDNEAWKKLELQAREAKKGLWSQDNPQAPWDFRHK
jgi:endonuclease YncB( thermonuclease family)